ncbi:MAG: glucose 1-dehydrogenase [Novosphingobium sp.]|nr:glucose 1-dehydrogenase [Novosphingobium sp.]
MGELEGKTALVTGASKGIGSAIARALAAAGAAVGVNYASDRAGAERTVAAIAQDGGRALAIGGSVASADDARRMVAETVAAFGSLDILVNNAAAYDMGALEEITEAEYHRHFGTNVFGPLMLVQAALAHFRPGSCILNISSSIVLAPEPQTSLYSASKAALNMLAKVWAAELGSRQIRVATISPGITHTDGHPVRDWGDEIVAPLIARTPLGRIGDPEDVANAAVFLASERGRWITGADLHVSGGFR